MRTDRPVSAAWTAGVLGLSLVGVAIATYLTHLHLQLFYGAGVSGSLCDFGDTFNCSSVNAAPESEVAGVPQAVLALPVYVTAAVLGILESRRRDGQAALTLGGMMVLAVGYGGWLAFQMATVIHAWCLFCLGLDVVNVLLLGLALVGGRTGVGGAIGGMVRVFARAPGLVAAAFLVAGVSFGASWAGYGQVHASMAAAAAKAAVEAPPAATPETKTTASASDDSTGTRKLRLGAARAEVVPPADAPSLGPKNAKVQVVELSDFDCPFCKRLASSLRQLVNEYPNDVRLVYVEYPLNTDCNRGPLKKTLHPNACAAASAGYCAAEQGKFWPMHDALFEQQTSHTDKAFLEMATAAGLDTAKFSACTKASSTRDGLLGQTEIGTTLNVSGTPTFFINGRLLSGAQPIEVLRAVVEAELAGNKAALDLDVAVGTETLGDVPTTAEAVDVPGVAGVKIDSFEASLNGKLAESRAGVEPARSVSWYEADAACKAAGKRLCTEKEWLAACTGTAESDADGNGVISDDPIRGLKYGYSNDRLAGACADSRNPDSPGDVKTGNHPKCSTPSGAWDMVGGVKEWTGVTASTAALKGGSYTSGESARCGYYRDDYAPETKDVSNGFRCCEGPPDPAPPTAAAGRDVGEKLAPFEVPLVDGKDFSSRSLAGKPAIVTFWATWCGPCQKEMPALASLYTTWHPKGLELVAISVDKDASKLQTWLGAHTMPFLIGKDPAGELMHTFPNRGLPTTLWIKKDGTIRLRTTGLPPNGEKRIGELVQELMGG